MSDNVLVNGVEIFFQMEFNRLCNDQIYRVYPQRFWVLFVFAFLSFNQYMFWLTFSPIALSAEKYYQITEATIDLLLNWGPIIFLPTLPLIYFLVHTHHGLKKCVLIFAILLLIATIIRLIPSIILSPSDQNFYRIAVPFLHLGQILIAVTGPICMALVSQLSCLWFAPHERTRATTFVIVGGSLGAAVAFLISPHLVSEPSRVPRLLYFHAGQALLACICTLLYFPADPPSPPSGAAELLLAEQFRTESLSRILRRSLSEVLCCFKDSSCILSILSGALIGGTLVSWSGLFATILTPLGYTESQAGWFGFGQAIAGIAGALTMGHLADQQRFQRSLKSLILFSLICSFILCLIFQLSVRTVFWPNSPPLPSTVLSLGLLISFGGFFNGAITPLIYECLAEMMHPLPESLTASIYVELFNLVALIFLAIAPNRYQLMNLLVVSMLAIGIVMISCVRVTYKRKDEEERKEMLLTHSSEQSMDL